MFRIFGGTYPIGNSYSFVAEAVYSGIYTYAMQKWTDSSFCLYETEQELVEEIEALEWFENNFQEKMLSGAKEMKLEMLFLVYNK